MRSSAARCSVNRLRLPANSEHILQLVSHHVITELRESLWPCIARACPTRNTDTLTLRPRWLSLRFIEQQIVQAGSGDSLEGCLLHACYTISKEIEVVRATNSVVAF
jgi:hypothetical protein